MKKSPPGITSATYLITIGVLLALFAGSVALLSASPRVRKIFIRVPVGAPAAQPTPFPAPGAAPSPAPTAAPERAALPEGGSVELVNEYDPADQRFRDQKVVWRVEGAEDIVLVESVRTLLPGLEANDEALFLFAKPTNAERVFYAANCYAACDSLPHDLIAFDPRLRAFIPLLNAPKGDLIATDLSQNQRRLAFGGPPDEAGEIRELWIYNLVEDRLSRPLSLPSPESLTAYGARAEGAGPLVSYIDVSWQDPTRVTYKVYRAGGGIPEGANRARTPIATRTTQVAP